MGLTQEFPIPEHGAGAGIFCFDPRFGTMSDGWNTGLKQLISTFNDATQDKLPPFPPVIFFSFLT